MKELVLSQHIQMKTSTPPVVDGNTVAYELLADTGKTVMMEIIDMVSGGVGVTPDKRHAGHNGGNLMRRQGLIMHVLI